MATERLSYLIEAIWKGSPEAKKAASEIGQVGEAGEKSSKSIANTAASWAKGALTLGAVTVAAKTAYNVISEGAELELARDRFDNLAASIGTTADAMLNNLRQATSGMRTDAELVNSASQIISLGLMDTEDGVVRLASVVGELGWDMQQLIQTFANNSKARLDALGLSVTDVEERTQKFIAQGIHMDQAFDLAVLEAGEAKMELLGSTADTTAGKLARLETIGKNAVDAFKLWAVDAAEPAIDGLIRMADAQETLDAAVGRGLISQQEAFNVLKQLGTPALREATDATIENLNARLEGGDAAWAAAAAEDQLRKAMSDGTTAAYEVESAFEAAMAAVEDYTSTTVASAEATYEMRREGIDSSEALRAKLVSDYEEQIAKTEALEEATRELAQTYAGEFKTALDAGDEGTQNFTTTMFDSAVQAGANSDALVALALATGEYTEEQVEAALKTAAMTVKAEELGQAIADGTVTVEDAIAMLGSFETALDRDYIVEVDSEQAMLAEQRARQAKVAVQDLDGSRADVHVTTHFHQQGTPYSGPYDDMAPDYQHGTGGWLTVPPGYPNDTYRINMTSGERFAVVPAGQNTPAADTRPILHIAGDLALYGVQDVPGLLEQLDSLTISGIQ